MSDHQDIRKSIKTVLDGERLYGGSEIFRSKHEKPENSGGEGILTGLPGLEEQVKGCTSCELALTRTNVVFGEGDPDADLMFVGEAPGQDEDLKARPFVGRAGQLLTKIIESIGLKREDVFIANILKCRPPGNRNPLPEEIELCSPFLKQQISAINPKIICALGKFAAQTLLGDETPISKLRGRSFDYMGIKLISTYHPAYLLRNSAGKKDVWEDMKKIAKELGLKVPRKRAEK